MSSEGGNKQLSTEQILAGLNGLRTEQREVASKLSQLQMDLNEHKLVIETLRGVEGDRKCFKLVGGILTERTVSQVLPELVDNSEKMVKIVDTYETQMSEKGKEVNAYIEKHNIQVRGPQNSGKMIEAESEAAVSQAESKGTSGVLVNTR